MNHMKNPLMHKIIVEKSLMKKMKKKKEKKEKMMMKMMNFYKVIKMILKVKVDYFVIMIKFLELNLLKNHIDRFLKNVIWYNLSIKLLLILVQPVVFVI